MNPYIATAAILTGVLVMGSAMGQSLPVPVYAPMPAYEYESQVDYGPSPSEQMIIDMADDAEDERRHQELLDSLSDLTSDSGSDW